MYKRLIEPKMLRLAKEYPVITLMGPRQSGKTTLVRHAFPKKPYVNLELLDIRELATVDPRAFLSQFPDGAILDEIQQVPSLLSYIQGLVDESQKLGMFILTGSHQMELHQAVTQSLAGRTALLHLLPLSLVELMDAHIDHSLDDYLLMGGYPRIYKDHLNPTEAYRNYYQTYVERDLRQLIQVKNLSQFQKFIRLCAGRIGQLLNVSSLANDVGVSSHTIKEWLSILEASYVIVLLQPYYENLGKRIVKSPKLYFTDVGLVSYLLGIETSIQVARDPLRGHLVENLVFLELLKARYNQGLDPQLYFFRDTHGHEVDFVFKSGNELIPIEVKSGQTFNSEFLKNLRFFKDLLGDRFQRGYVVYTGSQKIHTQGFEILNFTHAAQAIMN